MHDGRHTRTTSLFKAGIGVFDEYGIRVFQFKEGSRVYIGQITNHSPKMSVRTGV